MRCRSVEKRIQELLDDRLDPSFDYELIEHVSICVACRDLLEGQGKLFDGLHFLTIPAMSTDFSRRVVGTVVMQRRRPAQRLAPVAAVLAIIATLLLVVALGPHQRKSIGPADGVASVSVNHSRQGRPMGLSVVDFDSREVRMAIEQFVAQLTSGSGSRFYQVDQLAGTIRPLASTLNVAFDAIRRSIPRRRDRPHPEPQADDLRVRRASHLI
ncbi:MAG: zf-HC2 domain-containing protein [Pirellulaceae bacterium]|nr:zf-HC2 domain-containing protein [Pirellulaceae bacterium]